MLIMQTLEERLNNICEGLKKTNGEAYAAAFKPFILNLERQGKIKKRDIYATMQAFWDDTDLKAVNALIASDEYEYDEDAKSYLVVLKRDIEDNLERQAFAAKNGIIY